MHSAIFTLRLYAANRCVFLCTVSEHILTQTSHSGIFSCTCMLPYSQTKHRCAWICRYVAHALQKLGRVTNVLQMCCVWICRYVAHALEKLGRVTNVLLMCCQCVANVLRMDMQIRCACTSEARTDQRRDCHVFKDKRDRGLGQTTRRNKRQRHSRDQVPNVGYQRQVAHELAPRRYAR
jgi:hypothetical protein